LSGIAIASVLENERYDASGADALRNSAAWRFDPNPSSYGRLFAPYPVQARFAPMSRSKSPLPTALGVFTLLSLAPLLVWDACPGIFPARAHSVLGAVPLTFVALAYLVSQSFRRVAALELAKAVLCALAFFFWALNQLLPDHPQATLFNDIAVAAFVIDLVLVIFGWPPAEAIAEPARGHSQDA
jgi:hypothetical protein